MRAMNDVVAKALLSETSPGGDRRDTIVHIQLSHGLSRRKTTNMFEQGQTPEAAAYGFHHAEHWYDKVTYSEDFDSVLGRMTRKLSMKLLGFDVVHAWTNRRLIDQADVVWTMIDGDFLSTLFIQKCRPWRRTTPVIAQCVWLCDINHKHGPMQRALHDLLAKQASILLTHSNLYLPIMHRRFPRVRSEVNFFGVSAEAFPIVSPRASSRDDKLVIFAPGNDRTRDWDTLLEAFGNDPRFDIILVCRWIDDEWARQFENLTVVRNPTMDDFRHLYLSSDLVAVPMHPNLFSGITVALEAAALGTPIMSADTGGVPTYFSDDEAIFVPTGNAAAWKARILSLSSADRLTFASRAQARFLRDGYTTRDMVGRYVRLTDSILADSILTQAPFVQSVSPSDLSRRNGTQDTQ